MDSGDDEVIQSAMPANQTRTRISASNGTSWSPPPEHRLVSAVLVQAVQDLERGNPTVQQSVRAWIRSETGVPWSFQWCCDLLDLDAEQVRTRLKAPMPANVRRGKGSV